ncbi:regulator of chromosome condensation 1/beta-lactamase-inhibitor protein II, partial [Baffinella frigidus]
VLRCLVRYAESKHLETIRDRANLRYQTDPDGTNRLFTWGCGLNGRLGHGYGLSYATPHEVHSLPASAKVVEVACGCEHSICRTYDGSVLSWGNGDRGQLGTTNNYHGVGINVQTLGTTDNYHGVGINVHMRPQPVFALKRYFILQISAGRWHNAVLTSD